jgi:spermidine synthase
MNNNMHEMVLARKRTPYQEIELTELPDGSKALYLNGHIQFVTGHDDVVYHGVMAGMPARMLQGKPGTALILGGGDGLAARNLFKFKNIGKVHMVELDPGMVDFSARHPIMRQIHQNAFQNPKLTVETMDAKKWIERAPKEKYTIGILDFPDPTDDSLESLFDKELYDKVSRHLDTPRAIWSIQASAAHSPVEDVVRNRIQQTTGTKAYPVRFRGYTMEDGTIMMAGKGVVPSETRMHPYWSPETEKLRTLGVF